MFGLYLCLENIPYFKQNIKKFWIFLKIMFRKILLCWRKYIVTVIFKPDFEVNVKPLPFL